MHLGCLLSIFEETRGFLGLVLVIVLLFYVLLYDIAVSYILVTIDA